MSKKATKKKTQLQPKGPFWVFYWQAERAGRPVFYAGICHEDRLTKELAYRATVTASPSLSVRTVPYKTITAAQGYLLEKGWQFVNNTTYFCYPGVKHSVQGGRKRA